MTADPIDVVRLAFDLYHRQDEAAARAIYAEDFRFTSPQDDAIDKEAFLERCFPTASHFARYEMLDVLAARPDVVFARYEYELKTGAVHQNVEAITVQDGLIHETQVYFGGRQDLPPPRP